MSTQKYNPIIHSLEEVKAVYRATEGEEEEEEEINQLWGILRKEGNKHHISQG